MSRIAVENDPFAEKKSGHRFAGAIRDSHDPLQLAGR
jgi:hypothetical protein